MLTVSAFILSSSLVLVQSVRIAHTWLCLERCGFDSNDILAQIDQYAVNSSLLGPVVAFERFNLGNQSNLIVNNLTMVAPIFNKMGYQSLAMVSSYPYPPEFLTYMRTVFKNPQPFINDCVDHAKKEGLAGYNIDWEPTDGNGAPVPTAQDALDYANFLDVFSKAMHANQLIATVCIATWSPIWNMAAIGATAIDFVMQMETYTDDWTIWQQQFANTLNGIPNDKLIVGLETVKSDGSPYSDSDLKLRFDAIKAANIDRIGIWDSPIPDNWWQFISAL
jgi:hypothetical protein